MSLAISPAVAESEDGLNDFVKCAVGQILRPACNSKHVSRLDFNINFVVMLILLGVFISSYYSFSMSTHRLKM